MKSKITRWTAAASLLLGVASAMLRAESINPATIPQAAPMTAQEKKNLQFALDWWRECLQSRHMELAAKYMAADYIQHNPNFDTGREGVVKVFGARPPVNPIPAKMANPP